MIKRLSIIFILHIFCLPLFSQLKVTVVEDSLYSKSLNNYMRFNVILPANYYLNDERYTTLYLLHGFSGNQDAWVTNTGLVAYAKDYNFIIVTPDAKNRWYTNSLTIKNSNYENYIIKDLIPFVENKYRTLSIRHGRSIAGISMGGYGAMKLGLKYSGTFFFAASISGGLQFPGILEGFFKSNDMKWVEQSLKDAFGEKPSEQWRKNDPIVLADSIPVASMPYLYVSIGKDDPLIGIIEANKTFTDKLRKRKALYEYHELPGEHNWAFGDKEIAIILWKLSKFDPLKP